MNMRDSFPIEEKKNPLRLEIISTFEEAAKVLRFSRMSLYRYRQMYPDFPDLPAFAMSLRGWKERSRLPRKRGPLPSQRSKQTVYLRQDQGMTFEQIGKKLGISKVAAWGLWRRYTESHKSN